MAIQVGASSQTWLPRRIRDVAPQALLGVVRAGRRLGLGVLRDAEAVDRERDAVHEGVEQEDAWGPNTWNSGPASTKPTISPASVAASNRATALPRRSSSAAVAKAMNPRIDGTDAAVDAPSRSRVKPMHGEAHGERGDDHGDGAEPRAEAA